MRTDQLIALAAKEAEEMRARRENRPEGAARETVTPPALDGAGPASKAGLRAGDQPIEPGVAAATQPPVLETAPQTEQKTVGAPPPPSVMQAEKPASQPAPQPATTVYNDSAQPRPNWQEGLPLGNKQVASKGLIFIFGFLALFFAWAFLFPISSAVVAMGKMVSAGSNKLVQHPQGGVVQKIYARDGDLVTKGQPLLLIDPSVSRAELTRLTARQRLLTALQTRLNSERGGQGFANTVEVSGLNLRGAQANAAEEAVEDELLEEQRREFDAGRKRLAAEKTAATSLIESLKDERSGLEARLAGARSALQSTRRELARMRPLAQEGYLPKARMWELERRGLEEATTATNLEASIDSTGQRIAEAEAKLAQLEQADEEKRAEELTRVSGELAEISDQIKAAQTAFDGAEIRAPVTGTLTKMAANTEGGVVRAGDTIAEIVPKDAGLITEFRVPLQSIKSVKVGQDARVVVTAFNRRTYDPIQAEVTYVSADSEIDEATQEQFFVARAQLKENPKKNNGLSEIQAGMTTEVYALVEPRVFMDYVLQPIRDSFSKAFRETK
ncbi:MAG: HlyD family type I secretion periplasmic adaptor subunit [Pseudomonadota bacterium]